MSEEIKRRIRDVVSRLDAEIRRLAAEDPDFANLQPRAHAPASAAQIERYEAHLGLRLPDSYRAFLELHNGYDALNVLGDILPVEAVQPGGKYYDDIAEWKRVSARYGSPDVLDGVVIANTGQPNNWVYLDPNRPSGDHDWTVVEWEPEESEEFASLEEYLEDRIRLAAEDDDDDEDEDDDED